MRRRQQEVGWGLWLLGLLILVYFYGLVVIRPRAMQAESDDYNTHTSSATLDNNSLDNYHNNDTGIQPFSLICYSLASHFLFFVSPFVLEAFVIFRISFFSFFAFRFLIFAFFLFEDPLFVFIAGSFARCGSTLLGELFEKHPQFTYLFEPLHFLADESCSFCLFDPPSSSIDDSQAQHPSIKTTETLWDNIAQGQFEDLV